MSDSVKRFLEFLMAGLVLWLIQEEIKEYRENKKTQRLIKELTQVPIKTNTTSPGDQQTEISQDGRTIMY